jgi:hypothetical protein
VRVLVLVLVLVLVPVLVLVLDSVDFHTGKKNRIFPQ